MKNPSTVPHKKTPYASAYGVFVSIGIRVISDEGGLSAAQPLTGGEETPQKLRAFSLTAFAPASSLSAA